MCEGFVVEESPGLAEANIQERNCWILMARDCLVATTLRLSLYHVHEHYVKVVHADETDKLAETEECSSHIMTTVPQPAPSRHTPHSSEKFESIPVWGPVRDVSGKADHDIQDYSRSPCP
jgi:hypothetical protein